MRFTGKWLVCTDGEIRPVIRVEVLGIQGTAYSENFLIDTGADRTVLSAAFLNALQLPGSPAPLGLSLAGIGGMGAYVVVATVLVFTADDGSVGRFQGQFAAFTDPAATDRSILGRDVLDRFDVILSRRRNEVLLLIGNHPYRVI